MNNWTNMHPAGIAVVVVILGLFALSLVLLFITVGKYQKLNALLNGKKDIEDDFLCAVADDYASAWEQEGDNVNTPAIIANSMNTHLSGFLFFERFLNNAVSLFVTLGLFGTFMGLSLSVSSLTELISYSNTAEWLSVLDSVGGGLMSALSGMGVAFYTSLVGVACSILLTVFRSICSPQNEREKLETAVELWLDHSIAATLPLSGSRNDGVLVQKMLDGLQGVADSMKQTLRESETVLKVVLDDEKNQLQGFNKTVNSFNQGVKDFSEFNYELRGTVERMDLAVRDLTASLRQAEKRVDK